MVAILSHTRQVAGSSPAGGAAIIAGQGDFSDSASKPVPSACYLRLSLLTVTLWLVRCQPTQKGTRHDNHRTPSHPAYRLHAWCEYGDGHSDALFRGDQSCWGPRSYVDLSVEEVNRDEFDVYTRRVGATACRQRPTQSPSVYVTLDGIENYRGGRRSTLDQSVHLTADEADELARAHSSRPRRRSGKKTR